jgi:hypothetical protein
MEEKNTEASRQTEVVVPVSAKEVSESFQVLVNGHSEQQRALYDQMVSSIRQMYEFPGESARGTSKKLAANRVSLMSLTNLAMYLTAHQRLVSSLVADIADGKIGKKSRKAKDRKTKGEETKKRKLEERDAAVPVQTEEKKRKLEEAVTKTEAKSMTMADRAASLLRRLESKTPMDIFSSDK